MNDKRNLQFAKNLIEGGGKLIILYEKEACVEKMCDGKHSITIPEPLQTFFLHTGFNQPNINNMDSVNANSKK